MPFTRHRVTPNPVRSVRAPARRRTCSGNRRQRRERKIRGSSVERPVGEAAANVQVARRSWPRLPTNAVWAIFRVGGHPARMRREYRVNGQRPRRVGTLVVPLPTPHAPTRFRFQIPFFSCAVQVGSARGLARCCKARRTPPGPPSGGSAPGIGRCPAAWPAGRPVPIRAGGGAAACTGSRWSCRNRARRPAD